MVRILGLGLCATLSSLASLAQTQLHGRVLSSATKQPLSQVSVQVTGQHTGTTTDATGRFSLSVPADVATLTVSHLGYQPLTVPAAQLGAEVLLAEQTYLIGEVQISHARLRQLLLRRWRLDSAHVAAQTRKDIDQMCIQNPSSASQREEMYRLLFQTVSDQRREYRDKGIVKTWGGIGGTNSRLRWQFDEATRTINVEVGEGTRPTTVLELTAERLVVQRYDGFITTWVPAEK